MAFQYLTQEEIDNGLPVASGKRCPLQVARYCYEGECQWWLENDCAINIMAKGFVDGIRTNGGDTGEAGRAVGENIGYTGSGHSASIVRDNPHRADAGIEE